jgi:hypothetical protein
MAGFAHANYDCSPFTGKYSLAGSNELIINPGHQISDSMHLGINYCTSELDQFLVIETIFMSLHFRLYRHNYFIVSL